MKKILLFLFVFFIALNIDIKAQNIDSLVVSQAIDCPLDPATLDAYLSQSLPPVNYNIVLQTLQFTGWQLQEDVLNTQITFYSFNNLQAGMYRLLLTDPLMTNYPTGSNPLLDPLVIAVLDIFIPGPSPLFLEAEDDTLDCWDETTADLTVSFTGLTSPYFTWLEDNVGNPISGSSGSPISVIGSSHTFTGLSVGDYVIWGDDINGCGPGSITHTITAPDTLRPDAQVLDSISCYQANDGEITVDVTTGGTPPYTYSWSNGEITSTISNLGPGNYWCTITDSLGCDTITEVFTLFEPGPLSGTATITNTINCKDSCNGEIFATIVDSGAGPPFNYSLDGITFQSDSNFTNLCFGVYTITIMDSDSCESITNSVTLIEPDYLEFSIDTISYNGFGVSCNGVCDAEITIDSVWGGNLAPHGYSSSYYGGTSFIDTLIAADSCISQGIGGGSVTFSYMVTDSLGCEGNNSITLDEPPLFTINHTVALKPNGFNLSCASSCDGEITVLPSGGVPNDSISYYYINSLFDVELNPLSVFYGTACATPIGGDTLIAIDANGCPDTNFVNLTSPPPFSWTMMSADENCALSNGSAWVDGLTGGLAPYTYDWTSSNGTGPFPNIDSIANLASGWYYLTVTDGLLCTFSDSAFVDSAYILVDYTVNVPCNAIDNGAININTNNVLLSEVTLLLIDNITIPNTSSTIVSYISTYDPITGALIQDPNIATVMTFNGLASTLGNEVYELRVELFGDPQGAAGCDPVSYYIEIGDSVSMDASLDVLNSDLNLTCFGDSTDQIQIDVHDSFGLFFSPSGNDVLASLVGGGVFIPGGAITAPFNLLTSSSSSLHAGTYSVFIQSNLSQHANCFDTVTFTVNQPDSLEFILGSTSALCNDSSDGTIYIDTIFGGTSPYTLQWRSDSINGPIIAQNLDSVVGLQAGWYYLSVIESAGCPGGIDSIYVSEPSSIVLSSNVLRIDECAYPNNVGSFEIIASGGNGYPYTWYSYDINGTPIVMVDSVVPDQLYSDWYYFIVTDNIGCSTLPDSVFIPNGVSPILDQSYVNNVSCFGANDGSYIAVVDSLNPLGSSASPFVFLDVPFGSIIPAPQGTMSGPDTIPIHMRDALGCQATDSIIILEPELLEITHFDTLTYIGGYNVSCNGSLDGEIIVNAVGGTPIYTYWVQDISTTHPASTNDTISGLAATFYEAFVQDNNGCLDSLEIFMTQPDSLLINSFFLDTTIAGGWNVSCFGFSDGQATVYVSGGNQGYYYEWEDPIGVIFSDTIAIVDSLWANASYTVTVTDTNGCTVSGSTAVLTEPTPLVINNITSNSPLLCKGGDDGTAEVFVSGATPGYAYLWDNANDTIPTYFNPNDTVPSLNDTTAFADTLRAGTYNVEVWDTNGCYVTGSVDITEPSISITIDSLAVTQMDCFNWNNADVQVFTTGPQPTPYLYTLYNEADELDTIYPLNSMSPSPQGNVAFSALYALTYVVYVEDNLGCLDRDTFIIDPLDSVYIDTVIYSNVSCNGYADGYIEVIVPMGGTPPYQYSIIGNPNLYPSWICNQNPNTCPTGYVFSGLAASPNPYTVAIWDSNGCANSYNVTITEPSPMIINDSTSYHNGYQIACNGGTDNIWFDISGGDAPYEITLGSTTIITNGSYVWTGLGQGIHSFIIEDITNGCAQSLDVTLNEPPAISVTPTNLIHVFCQDSCTGEVTAVVSGGVGNGNGNNYTYQWWQATPLPAQAIVGETSYYIDSLCSGDYYIEVTDENFCSYTHLITIGGANVLQILPSTSTTSIITDVGCFEDCDGSITVDVIGGVPSSTGAYSYQWNDPLAQTTQTAIGLCAGTYICIVTDMDGCSVTETFTVTQPVALIVEIVPVFPNIPGTNPPIQAVSAILCNGETGKLKVSFISPGTPSYGYLWSDGGTANMSSNLIAGSYSCFVTDGNGCTDTAHYYLDEPDVLEVLSTNISVDDVLCKGEGTGEIEVVATGGTPIPGLPPKWTYVLSPTTSTVVNDTGIFTGLSTGIYTVSVTDFHGCVYTTDDIFVGEPDNKLEITIDTYDESCNQSAAATVYPTGGTPGYTVLWDTDNIATSGLKKYLTSGAKEKHIVEVWDANLCYVIDSISLLGYLNVFFPPDYADSYDSTYCLGDQIDIDIDERPGLSYVWTIENNGETIATTADLEVNSDSSWLDWLPNEGLILTITDASSIPVCSQTVTAYIWLNQLDLNCTASSVEDVGTEITIVEGTEITLWSQPGHDTYSWTNSDNEELATVNEFSIFPTNSDWYYIYATAGPCIGYHQCYVAVGVISVDAISPNGDLKNDDWYIEDLGLYNSTVQLFNRWGDMLFEYKGSADGKDRITNDDFDWTSLSIGTYYYIIDLDNGSVPQTGPLTIIK